MMAASKLLQRWFESMLAHLFHAKTDLTYRAHWPSQPLRTHAAAQRTLMTDAKLQLAQAKADSADTEH